MRESDILSRIPGYSNESMYKQCMLLASVVNAKKEVKVGRGKNIRTIEEYKHTTQAEVRDRINRSVEYYKSQMEEPSIQFRDYQKEIIRKGTEVLQKHLFLYLAMEVRTGKTLTSLGICQLLGVSKVVFLTKKKAISSIQSDYDLLKPDYKLEIINYESLHKVEMSGIDVLICDEAHGMGAFPKPNQRAQMVSHIIKTYNPYVILLSGTPTPESYSQMYHQVYGIRTNPFKQYANFYKFSKDFVNVKQKKINSLYINDYTDGLQTIIDEMKPYTINYTQREAGFKVDTREHILQVEMSDITYKLCSQLKKNLVIEGKEETILADTPVKLMMKLHQLYSGTIKFESGNSTILDTSKAEYIKQKFEGKKIGVFYKFKEELNALTKVFGKENLTTELCVFKDTDCKVIALQIVSGREGISLREADALVYYNIDFSATSYWQSRDRMTTKDRLESDVYWIFSKGGIEKDIYKAVSQKKDYTLNHFKKDLLNL